MSHVAASPPVKKNWTIFAVRVFTSNLITGILYLTLAIGRLPLIADYNAASL